MISSLHRVLDKVFVEPIHPDVDGYDRGRNRIRCTDHQIDRKRVERERKQERGQPDAIQYKQKKNPDVMILKPKREGRNKRQEERMIKK